jgi:hypothetical protein
MAKKSKPKEPEQAPEPEPPKAPEPEVSDLPTGARSRR